MRNEIYVKVKGLNLSRLINKLIQNDVFINNLVYKKGYIKFSIKSTDECKLKRICNFERKTYYVYKEKGIKSFTKRLPYLLGSFLAILISFCYMFSYVGVIHKINIDCDSVNTFNEQELNNVLVKNGITKGVYKSKISPQEIEKIILKNCDDIAGCSIKIDGGVLDILVYPATEKLENTNIDLVSKYDAVITFAEAYAGLINHKVGDIVKAGDVLIKNNNGANGKIEGKVYFVGSVLHSEKQQYYQKTGNNVTKTSLKIFNKNLTKQPKCLEFTNYLEEKCDFLLTNLFLPIKKEVITFYETEIKEKIVLFEDVENEIKKQAFDSAISQLPAESQYQNVTYSVVRDGLFVKVDCYLEVVLSLI